jgi:hypothetical protein
MIVLLAICGAFVVVEVLQLHVVLRINRKPFNCSVCLAGWFTLLLYLLPFLKPPFLMASAMVGIIALNKLIKS